MWEQEWGSVCVSVREAAFFLSVSPLSSCVLYLCHREVRLCVWQNVRVQLLTYFFVRLWLSIVIIMKVRLEENRRTGFKCVLIIPRVKSYCDEATKVT